MADTSTSHEFVSYDDLKVALEKIKAYIDSKFS